MENKITKDWCFWLFLALSVIWSVRVFWLLYQDQYNPFIYGSMPLNEVGDFLAGSFSPLAFFWLAYGYWMQNRELRLSNMSNQERIKNDLESIYLTKSQLQQERNILASSEKKNISSSGLKLQYISLSYDNDKVKIVLRNDGRTIEKIFFYEASAKKRTDILSKSDDSEISLNNFILININELNINNWEKDETKTLELHLLDENIYERNKDKSWSISEYLFCFKYYDLRVQKRLLELKITVLENETDYKVYPEILHQSDISNTLHRENPWLSKK